LADKTRRIGTPTLPAPERQHDSKAFHSFRLLHEDPSHRNLDDDSAFQEDSTLPLLQKALVTLIVATGILLVICSAVVLYGPLAIPA